MNNPRFFSSGADKSIQCELCPRKCLLPPDSVGACRVRFNKGGKPELPFYGFITAMGMDPIEKKPLYHFRPGSEILSVGFAGCNLRCPFCQNWHISQNTDSRGRMCTPMELVAAAGKTGLIAYTYSEPLVHIEFLLDCMKEARKAGIANVLVTNGCVNAKAAEEILGLSDAANIDLKTYCKETYAKKLGGDLETVLEFIKTACKKGVHVELTTLVVPGLNDSEKELDACVDFIASLENNGTAAIPWHLSAYHPDWKWDAPPTDHSLLAALAALAKKKLRFVYTGNTADQGFSDTICPNCGKILVGRRAYRINTSGLSTKSKNGKPHYYCASCGNPAPIS